MQPVREEEAKTLSQHIITLMNSKRDQFSGALMMKRMTKVKAGIYEEQKTIIPNEQNWDMCGDCKQNKQINTFFMWAVAVHLLNVLMQDNNYSWCDPILLDRPK